MISFMSYPNKILYNTWIWHHQRSGGLRVCYKMLQFPSDIFDIFHGAKWLVPQICNGLVCRSPRFYYWIHQTSLTLQVVQETEELWHLPAGMDGGSASVQRGFLNLHT